MVDIHCHILSNVDDGSDSQNTSIEMAEIAVSDGINVIIATPHYIEFEHEITKEEILNKCNDLNKILIEKNIILDIKPGCEAFISPTIVDSYKKGKVMSINNMDKYILIELPVSDYPKYTEEVIFDFKLSGMTPIIAHIERYTYFYNDFLSIHNLIKHGALIQVNSSSINGYFGKDIKAKVLELIRSNMVHFIASDAHTTRGRSPKISQAFETLRSEKIEQDYINYIIENGYKVVEGAEINILEPILKKKKMFWF